MATDILLRVLCLAATLVATWGSGDVGKQASTQPIYSFIQYVGGGGGGGGCSQFIYRERE